MTTKNTLRFMAVALVSMNVAAEGSNVSEGQYLWNGLKACDDFFYNQTGISVSKKFLLAKETFSDNWKKITNNTSFDIGLNTDNNASSDVIINKDEAVLANSSKTGFSKVTEYWNGLTATQQYAIGATALTAVVAGIAYQLGCFSTSQNIAATEEDVQKIVETALQDISDSTENKLNYVVQALVNNGLGNIIVYNDNEFDVEDTFKVEFNENNVYVTRK